MNLLDKVTQSFEGKDENEATIYRKRKSLISGEEVTPKGKEENERTMSRKQKTLIQGQEVSPNEKAENETAMSQKQKALNFGEKVTASRNEENETTIFQKQKAFIVGEKVTPNPKNATETPRSCLTSIIPENIMLIYLKRSSVQYLLKDLETFECNILGSYVRIQSDPNDHSQKNTHQLVQVAGVKKCDDLGEEFILQVLVLPFIKEVHISMLSDEFFKKEECRDLRQKILVGAAYRPTVMEVQNKAQMLHKVITEQWLAKELSWMQSLIVLGLSHRNNMNGWIATDNRWRKELIEYLKTEAPLQKPAELEKIPLTIPNVITEDLNSDLSCFPKFSLLGTSAGVDKEGEPPFVKEVNGVLGIAKFDKFDLNLPPVNTNTAERTENRNLEDFEVIEISSDDDV
ncbi:uncharacterized protein LOC141698228 isoform X2 [Apium graveolens]|uniref:uncharacterized protein LOC141698228 isoform X2 n=1 Tax=Apium graveolens TaxID=4045 RepID=UPI003D7B130F